MAEDSPILAVENYGVLTEGRKYLIRHLESNDLTPQQAILAKCHECCGGFVDGKVDCGIKSCPLHPWMPYKPGGRKKDPQRMMAGMASSAKLKGKKNGQQQAEGTKGRKGAGRGSPK